MTQIPKERRKQMIFDYLRGLKNPVTAEHVGEKFKITKRRADQLLVELAADDLVIKTKGYKQQEVTWKKTMVICFAVKDEYRIYKKREPKVARAWHDPFGLGRTKLQAIRDPLIQLEMDPDTKVSVKEIKT